MLQPRRLMQLGALLFLLSLLIGLAIPALTVPRLGVSAHLNAVIGSLFLFVLSLVWPQLQLPPRALTVAYWFAPYSFFVATLMPLLGSFWGAGGGMLPIAAGVAKGTPLQEGVIAAGLISAGASVVILAALLLLGLRGRRSSS